MNYQTRLTNTKNNVAAIYKKGRQAAQAGKEPLTQEAIYAKLQSAADDAAIAQEYAQLLYEFYITGYVEVKHGVGFDCSFLWAGEAQ